MSQGNSRGGTEAFERRSEIGDDERQPVMARLAAGWRRSNFVRLVALRKENHPGEAYVRRDHRKRFIQKREGLFRGTP